MNQEHSEPNSIENTRIVGLSQDSVRRLKHRRSFTFEVYEREDGLWDIDAQMLDHKAHDITLDGQTRSVGNALHDMVIRITLDASFTIVAAFTQTQNAPYIKTCPSINAQYEQLVGLNVLSGFRLAVKDRFAKTQGCTHLTELINSLPTVAIQGMGFEISRRAQLAAGDAHQKREKPFQIGQCYAFKHDSEVVRLHYPDWYEAR